MQEEFEQLFYQILVVSKLTELSCMYKELRSTLKLTEVFRMEMGLEIIN